jgi:hypothetical protein
MDSRRIMGDPSSRAIRASIEYHIQGQFRPKFDSPEVFFGSERSQTALARRLRPHVPLPGFLGPAFVRFRRLRALSHHPIGRLSDRPGTFASLCLSRDRASAILNICVCLAISHSTPLCRLIESIRLSCNARGNPTYLGFCGRGVRPPHARGSHKRRWHRLQLVLVLTCRPGIFLF